MKQTYDTRHVSLPWRNKLSPIIFLEDPTLPSPRFQGPTRDSIAGVCTVRVLLKDTSATEASPRGLSAEDDGVG